MATTVRETFVARGSSNIGSFTYDPSDESLEVTFHSGDTYRYSDVPVNVYTRWCAVGGGGKFFYANVRDAFEFEKL
jgi:hypothetical protein